MSLQEYLFTGSSKVTSCGFWQKRVRLWDLLEGGSAVLQEPTLTVLLVLPKRGVFVRGGDLNIWGCARAPVAVINFASNPCTNL